MSYNVDNWGVIENGVTLPVGFQLDGGQGKGSQWAEGAPQDAGNNLTTTNARIFLGDDGKFTYGFDLTCNGRGTRYGLHGGGQT
jgi:hypothetical protein